MRTDNGSEFNYKELYDKFGIMHQMSCIETPQQNVVVERKHQHILKISRSIMFYSNMPKQYWSYAICHAFFIINRNPSTAMQFQVPYELLHKQKPDISFLKVFGCLCFVSTLTNNRNKFDPKSKKCIFLGFKVKVKGYIVLDLKQERLLFQEMLYFMKIHLFKKKIQKNQLVLLSTIFGRQYVKILVVIQMIICGWKKKSMQTKSMQMKTQIKM